MKEEWRVIPEYPRYVASNLGNIIGPAGTVLKPAPTKGGYLRVVLHEGGKRLNRSVHCLVALAFVGPRPNGFDCCHKNGNNQDNRAENLLYATHKENQSHMIKHGTVRRGGLHGMAKLTEENVRFILSNYKPRDREFSAVALGKRFGVDRSTIGNIIIGRVWKHIERGSE